MLIKGVICAITLVLVTYVCASEPPIETTSGDVEAALTLQQDQASTTSNTEPTTSIDADADDGGADSTSEELLDEQVRPPFIPGGRCVFCPGLLPRCPCRFPSECQLIPRTCFSCPRWTCARAQCVRCPGGLPPCRCGPFSRCVYEPGTCFRCPGWRCVPVQRPPFPPLGGAPIPVPF